MKVSGPIVTSHREVLKTAAVRGLGIAYGPVIFFREELNAGRVIEVLPKFRLPEATIYAVYPAGQQRSAKVLAFNDFMTRYFAAADRRRVMVTNAATQRLPRHSCPAGTPDRTL